MQAVDLAIEGSGKPVCLHDSGSPYWPSFGVIERFPELRIVHVEADAGWLPYWLQRMEQHWGFSGNAEHPQLKRSPAEYFKSSFLVACRADERTLPSVVELVGDSYLTFNTDDPQPDGAWPAGLADLEHQPLSEESIRRIFRDNAAHLFDAA
ncbi:MAG: amidohydrolase family protein [Pseudomonadales bacterium]